MQILIKFEFVENAIELRIDSIPTKTNFLNREMEAEREMVNGA